jgi:hypothetical protein
VPLSDLVGEYYERAEGIAITPGQLAWAPTFYLPAHPDVLVEVDPDPTEQRLAFRLQRATAQSFTSTSHRPLKSIELQVTEELVAVRAKRRLVVVLSQGNTIMEDLRAFVAKDRKIHEESFLCAPLYGVHREAAERGFPAVVLSRIQALMYVQFFYLPASSTEPDPAVYEAVARLDRLQPFHGDTLRNGRIGLRLRRDALMVLREWARGCLTGEVSRDVREIQAELVKELYGPS